MALHDQRISELRQILSNQRIPGLSPGLPVVWADVDEALRELQNRRACPTPEPPPITCCGEWTWDARNRIWVGPHARMWRIVDGDAVTPTCSKCHRALLEDGKMTGPLVDGERALCDFSIDRLEAELEDTWDIEDSK